MKIITWNCNMAFRKKAEFILSYKPDILIVPECEGPEKLCLPDKVKQPKNMVWVGKNRNKGLAIFSFGNYRLKRLKIHDEKLRLIVPIQVSGGETVFTLFAIWANNPDDKDGQYIEQVWKAIHRYQKIIRGKKTILAGDFNSNTIWDRKYRESNHSNVVKHLERKGIFSTYHHLHKQEQGKERHPTLYMYRHKDKPYHIDYCFVSRDLLDRVQTVRIGSYTKWIRHSDHVPVMVSFRET